MWQKIKKILRRLTLFIRWILIQTRADSITAFAAQAAFFLLISFFPFMLILLCLIRFLPFSMEDTLVLLTDFVPQALSDSVKEWVRELYHQSIGTVLSVSIVVALWSASGGLLAIMRGLNAVYGVAEKRPYLKLRAVSMGYTLVFELLLIITVTFMLAGRQILTVLRTQFPPLGIFSVLQPLLAIALLTAFFLLFYMVLPSRKGRKRYEWIGAASAAVCWIGFSYLYSFYIGQMERYAKLYGSMTAIVLLMLWLFVCMYVLLLGAELNDYLYRHVWYQRDKKPCKRKK